MYATARELGFTGTPEELANPETNCLYAVRYLNARAANAIILEQVARAYNGGNVSAKAVPQSYIDKLTAAYRKRVGA
jgi:soluble lytic murein transglycosylase-like protein